MKKAMFRYKMSLAGYSDEQIASVDSYIETGVVSCVKPHAREATLIYARVCRDLSMVPTFLLMVNKLYLESALEYMEAARWVTYIVAGWCK